MELYAPPVHFISFIIIYYTTIILYYYNIITTITGSRTSDCGYTYFNKAKAVP